MIVHRFAKALSRFVKVLKETKRINEGDKATKFNILNELLCTEVLNPVQLKDLLARTEN